MTLKPCPFCGYDPTFNKKGEGKAAYWIVECINSACGQFVISTSGYNREKALTAWNKRAPIPVRRVERVPFEIEEEPR